MTPIVRQPPVTSQQPKPVEPASKAQSDAAGNIHESSPETVQMHEQDRPAQETPALQPAEMQAMLSPRMADLRRHPYEPPMAYPVGDEFTKRLAGHKKTTEQVAAEKALNELLKTQRKPNRTDDETRDCVKVLTMAMGKLEAFDLSGQLSAMLTSRNMNGLDALVQTCRDRLRMHVHKDALGEHGHLIAIPRSERPVHIYDSTVVRDPATTEETVFAIVHNDDLFGNASKKQYPNTVGVHEVSFNNMDGSEARYRIKVVSRKRL